MDRVEHRKIKVYRYLSKLMRKKTFLKQHQGFHINVNPTLVRVLKRQDVQHNSDIYAQKQATEKHLQFLKSRIPLHRSHFLI